MLLGLLTSEQVLIRTVSAIAWRLDFDWNMKSQRKNYFRNSTKGSEASSKLYHAQK